MKTKIFQSRSIKTKDNAASPKRIGCLGWGLGILSAGVVVLMILLAVGMPINVKRPQPIFSSSLLQVN